MNVTFRIVNRQNNSALPQCDGKINPCFSLVVKISKN